MPTSMSAVTKDIVEDLARSVRRRARPSSVSSIQRVSVVLPQRRNGSAYRPTDASA
jgi:hypothetical protein